MTDWLLLEIWIILALTGLAAGFMAGLLGIGGGFVVVPLLLLILPQIGLPAELLVHVAVGTSLACIAITSLSSAYSHHRKRAINWPLLKPLLPGLIVGALLGSWLASLITGNWLVLVFVVGAMITAVYLLLDHEKKPQFKTTQPIVYFFFAQLTGIISSLIGIGGGSVLVPFLVYRGHPMVKSVATAAACGFPIAVFGSLGFMLSGWSKTLSLDYSSGFIYWPAFIGIVVFSSLSAPLGVKLAHFIQEKRLKQIFAVFLFLTSLQIIYSQWFSA
jgi:uncharacterized protein